MIRLALLASAATLALASTAFADPPERVGRISYVEGAVSVRPPSESDWVWANANFPLTRGEAFWTDDNGRLELRVGGIEAWLDRETQFDVDELDYGQARFAVNQGAAEVRVRRVPDGGLVITTPAGPVFIGQPGLYRIDVDPPGDQPPTVRVTTFEGAADAPGPAGPVTVGAGQAVSEQAGYDPNWIDALSEPLDSWSREREARQNWRIADDTPYDMTGAEDLNTYGDYVQTDDYGAVWFPRAVQPGWAPYRFGHWQWVYPWGWTWVDDAPWGFAPFHYGRWVQIDGRWGWVRGAPERHPVYAPALVTFIGAIFGGGEDRVGWVPLAPGEVFHPAYHVSDAYVRRVNITNVNETIINQTIINRTTVNNIMFNQYRNAGAAVFVKPTTMAAGAPVKAEALTLTREARLQPAATPAPFPTHPAPARQNAPAFTGGGQRPLGGSQSGSLATPPPNRSTSPTPMPGAFHPQNATVPATPAPRTMGRNEPQTPTPARPNAPPNGALQAQQRQAAQAQLRQADAIAQAQARLAAQEQAQRAAAAQAAAARAQQQVEAARAAQARLNAQRQAEQAAAAQHAAPEKPKPQPRNGSSHNPPDREPGDRH